MRDDGAGEERRVRGEERTAGVVLLGLGVGIISALIARVLSPQACPLVILPLLASTLVVGRLVTTGTALAYGVYVWSLLAGGAVLLHRVPRPWHGVPALLLLLLLLEEVALLGRFGRVGQVNARHREER